MSQLSRSTLRNRLLLALSPTDFDLLQPHLESVLLSVGNVLIGANKQITRVYFVEQGIVSSIATAEDGEQIELNLIGHEGMVGVPTLLGADMSSSEARVQAAGWAWSMRTDDFSRAIQNSSSLHAILLRYVQTVLNVIADTALANGRYKLDQRLARWLLMCHDRVEGNVFPTTHLFLSLMLGITRPSVTTAVNFLEYAGTITSKRGYITIVDRDALLTIAGASYGSPETEYERLIG